jgi:hypothetical protein
MFSWLKRWWGQRAKRRTATEQAVRYEQLRKELAEWRNEPATEKDARDWEEFRKSMEAAGNFDPGKQ